jgi:hypothetical protein
VVVHCFKPVVAVGVIALEFWSVGGASELESWSAGVAADGTKEADAAGANALGVRVGRGADAAGAVSVDQLSNAPPQRQTAQPKTSPAAMIPKRIILARRAEDGESDSIVR